MKQIFKTTTKQIIWALSMVVLFALPVGINAQTFTGAGNPQVIDDNNDPSSIATVNLPGTIGSAFVVDNVTINITHTFDGDLDLQLISPAGSVLNLALNEGGAGDNFINTVFTDNAPGSIVPAFAPFTGMFTPEGPGTFASVFAGDPVAGDWTLQVTDDFGGDDGTLDSYTITFAPAFTLCELDCSDPLTVGSDTDKCGATNPVIPAPVLSAQSLANGCVLLDANGDPGGSPSIFGYILPDGTTVNTLDCFPLGTTSVIFQATASGSGESGLVLCETPVTVIDDVAPVLNCPTDQTINLQGGECTTLEEFSITAIDNCSMGGGVSTITNGIGAGFDCDPADIAVTSGVGAFPADIYWLYPYEVTGGAILDEFCFPLVATNAGPYQVNVFCWDGDVTAIPNSQPGTAIGPNGIAQQDPIFSTLYTADLLNVFGVDCVDLTGAVVPVLDCGQIIVEVVVPGAEFLQGFGTGCAAIPANTLFLAGDFAPGALFDFSVFGIGVSSVASLTLDQPASVFTPLTGLDSGSELGIGVNSFSYLATDAAGNTSTCSFDITVNGISEDDVVTSLTCNDSVNISIDENCEFYVGADLFLEGGPYNCYDDCYEVYIFGPNNTPIPGVTFDASGDPIDYNNTNMSLDCGNYVSMVRDICTSDVTCWGEFVVEDKIAPVVTAPADVTLTCLQSTEPAEIFSDDVTVGLTSPIISDVTTPAGSVFGTVATGSITVPAIANSSITDINICIGADLFDVDDYLYFITAPDGTRIELFDGFNNALGCAGDDNIDVTFDSESMLAASCGVNFAGNSPNTQADILDCPGYWTGFDPIAGAAIRPAEFRGTFQPTGQTLGLDAGLTAFYGAPLSGGTYTFEVVAADFTAIGLAAPNDNICVSKVDLIIAFDVSAAGVADITNTCGDEVINIDDVSMDGTACGETIITRTFYATDAKGNVGSDTQVITVEQVGLDRLNSEWFFPDPIVTLNCNACVTPECIFDVARAQWVADNPALPSVLDDEDLLAIYNCNADAAGVRAAYPFSFNSKGLQQRFDINSCNLFFSTSDLLLETCGAGCSGNYKIIRTWTALDWCTGETAESIQTIDASDSEAPEIELPEVPGGVLTVSTSIHDCVANFTLPSPEHLRDNCDDNVTFTIIGLDGAVNPSAGNRVFGLPIGQFMYEYIAEDCCGNEARATLMVEVVDAAAPIAIATQNVVINLTSDPGNPEGGAAKLFVQSIDNGSHDGGCGPVQVFIRRTDNTSCDNIGDRGHNNNSTFDNRSNTAPFDSDDTDGGQFVKFCCEDLASADAVTDANGNTSVVIEVELLVVDAVGNAATTWANVRVESKLQPNITCPADVTIECDVDESDLFVTGTATGGSSCGAIDAMFMDLCGIDLDGDMEIEEGSDEDVFNKACHYGPITRIWYLEGMGAKCSQLITINEPTVQFDGSTQIDWPYSRNAFINIAQNDSSADCGGGISGNDIEVFENEDGDPIFSEVSIDCIGALCDEPIWVDATCSLIGWSLDSDTFFFEDDACRKIINTYTVIDWCQFNPADGSTDGIWTWKVVGKLIDPFPPVVVAENNMFPAIPGGSGSANPSSGACVGFATPSAIATDTSVDADGNVIDNACPSQWLKWIVLVDIGGDWIIDREFSSFVPEDDERALWSDSNGNGIPDVRVGNEGGVDNAENLAGLSELGTTPPGFEYMINIPDAIPADCGDTQHRVEWRAFDGCGNVTSTVSYFTVQDVKAPTPFCVNLSTALMEDPDGAGPEPSQVALWAIDFDFGSFDNCTDPSELRFTFTDVPPSDDPDFDPVRRSSTRVFSCDDLQAGSTDAIRNVDVYVWDACGNFDFCIARIRLVDNNENGCTDNGGTGSIAGTVETEFGETVEEVNIQNQDMQLDYVLNDVTDATGDYAFNVVDMNNDFEVTAEKNDDYLNGVSTLDLVVIQRHILGSARLDSPYKMIAADVNNDKAITAIDLIQLRKLILGVYDELPSNSSWRFADASVTMDATNPWNSIDETINIYNLTTDMMDENFIGIKIGDVNQSVVANAASTSTESRSAASVDVVFDNRSVEVGEIVELVIKGEAMNDLYGYQFTLGTGGLELVEVESGIIEVSNENFGVHGDKVTTSWNSLSPINTDGDLFTMTFKSNVAGELSEILDLNSSVTRAEAYVGSDLDIVNIELRNNEGVGSDYALFQNEPNPFASNTIVGFELPEAGTATISVRDVAGKVISVINGDYAKGYNEVELSKSDIGTAGVYFYQLDSGDFTATKKMIIIE